MERRFSSARLLLGMFLCLPLFPAGPENITIRGRAMDGERFSNDTLKGHVVLLQFWTTWCPVCRRDQPAVEEIVGEYTKRGLIVLAVNVNESKKTVEKYLANSPRTCKIVLTQDTNLAAAFEARSYPKYVVIDADGKVAGKQDGAGGSDALRRLLARAGLPEEE